MAYGVIDCRDCGPDWCIKHEPVTEKRRCPSGKHPLTHLIEGWGWCGGDNGRVYRVWNLNESWKVGAKRKYFLSYQQLNDWFTVNVIKEGVSV